MSDAATSPDAEDPPATWTEDGTELDMVWGNAIQRTDEPVVFVDARCVGCGRVGVHNVPNTADWTEKNSFADRCKACKELTPHNVLSVLSGLNRSHSRGYLETGDN